MLKRLRDLIRNLFASRAAPGPAGPAPEAPAADQRRPVPDAEKIPARPRRPASPAPAPQTVLSPPEVITREAWGARPYRGTPVKQPRYDELVLHHAEGFSATTRAEGIERMQQIQQQHQDERNWSDIAYHFVVDRGGHVYQGRPYKDTLPLARKPALVIGAHVAGQNTGKVGVCVLGCYDPGGPSGDPALPTDNTLDALVNLFAFLCDAYGIPAGHIKGHSDLSDTPCPGALLYDRLPEIRQRVASLLAARP